MIRTFVVIIGVMYFGMSTLSADEIVYRSDPGLLVYLKKNIRLADTVVTNGISYVHYYAKEGETLVPKDNVIEVRFIPYDLTAVSVNQVISDTVAIPIPRPTPLSLIKSVTVTSIVALKTALADNTIDEIVVANGTYSVTPSRSASNALFIDETYAGRTRPITIRAQTRGGVIFDGGGATGECIQFLGGVHDQTWDGFSMTRYYPASTGVINIGAWTNTTTMAMAVYRLTFRYINIYNCTGRAKLLYDPTLDHAIYVSYSTGGAHDLLFDNISIDDRNHQGLAAGFHFYHSDPSSNLLNAWNVTMSNITVRGTNQAFVLADATLKNILVTDAVIINTLKNAVDYEAGGPITLRNIISTGSGVAGFNSTQGANPSGVTIINCSFN
jgi:hypothetical protein